MSEIANKIEALCEKYPDHYVKGETMDLLVSKLKDAGLDANAAFELFKTLSPGARKKLVALLDAILASNPFAMENGMEHWSTIGGNYPYGHISIKPIDACWLQALAKLRDSMKSKA
jgi:hypothetical protein